MQKRKVLSLEWKSEGVMAPGGLRDQSMSLGAGPTAANPPQSINGTDRQTDGRPTVSQTLIRIGLPCE